MRLNLFLSVLVIAMIALVVFCLPARAATAMPDRVAAGGIAWLNGDTSAPGLVVGWTLKEWPGASLTGDAWITADGQLIPGISITATKLSDSLKLGVVGRLNGKLDITTWDAFSRCLTDDLGISAAWTVRQTPAGTLTLGTLPVQTRARSPVVGVRWTRRF